MLYLEKKKNRNRSVKKLIQIIYWLITSRIKKKNQEIEIKIYVPLFFKIQASLCSLKAGLI